MKKKGEKRALGNCSGLNSERRLVGKVALGGSETLIGRINFFDEGYTEGSVLFIYGGERIDRTALSLRPPIAIVAICCERGDTVADICSLGVPCIFVDWAETLSKDCKNKVVLLDTERGILALDPSIETLNFYSNEKSKRASNNFPCEQGRFLKSFNEDIRRLDFEHFLVFGDSACDGGSFFESAVSLWERRCPESLTIALRAPDYSESSARDFSERVEELFKASLYGSFALAISDFYCEEELERALKLLHKAFCNLEVEGREFNGYIPRGVVFSSPLWLCRPCPVTNPDFIILDLDRLLPSLFSLSVERIIKKEKLLKKELFCIFERYFINFMPRCRLYAKTERFFDTRLLKDLISAADIKIVYR